MCVNFYIYLSVSWAFLHFHILIMLSGFSWNIEKLLIVRIFSLVKTIGSILGTTCPFNLLIFDYWETWVTLYKVCSEIKETTFWVGHFTTISGHSIANYINIFHKTEVTTVILRCLTSPNLNWVKSDHINYKKI